ncbi:cupin-like domain-containing protein [Dactylosporangium sp. CA-092794]|uniref:cupin-like domain-containing protein n=1 Tax=Dactylosporangium sp. CA-092794 TaxID=3239929 RepID=UPI003D8DD101
MSGSKSGLPDILDNVRRVTSIQPEEFIENHLLSQQPVIITDTQAGAEISAVTTQEAVVKAFGDVVIQVQRNYTSPLSRNAAEARRQGLSQKVRNRIEEMRLEEYLAHVDADPQTDLLCVEYRTPERIHDALRVPDVCALPGAAEDLVSFTFVANRGNYAHLHFDGDFREVLLYQVFGRKRVVMVPLAAQEKISPSMNFSKVLLQNMAAEEKLDLLRYLGAYDCVISPGEAVYFPASIWHYVEYLDTGMSVNFRFGRDDFARKVVDANRVPFYPELHQLLSLLKEVPETPERAGLQDKIWTEISSTLRQEHTDSRARHRATQEMYRRLVADLLAPGELPRQVATDCPVAEQMAVERHDAPSKRWREELMLGDPL